MISSFNELPLDEICIDVFSSEILDLSFHWINDYEIQTLINAQPVTREMQEQWFATLANRSDFLIWGIRFNQVAIGVMGFKNIVNNEAEYWGYIGEKKYWGRGIGNWMMEQAFMLGATLNLKRIYLRVLATNARALSLYKRFDFKIVDSIISDNITTMERCL